MAKITFLEPDGTERTIDISTGFTIMEGAVREMVDGIEAVCGGTCSCATCMVYVCAEWEGRLPPRNQAETAMLQFCPQVNECSRLACQIDVTDDLDGLRLVVPATQR